MFIVSAHRAIASSFIARMQSCAFGNDKSKKQSLI
jgi:hypothetical protein